MTATVSIRIWRLSLQELKKLIFSQSRQGRKERQNKRYFLIHVTFAALAALRE